MSGSATTTQTGLAVTRRRDPAGERDALRERRAVEPVVRSASTGVPHAGQPSTPATWTAGGSGSAASARRSVSPSAPTGA